MNKEYKALFVPAELHAKVKVAAAKKKQTIIQFIEDLLKVL